MRTFALVLCLAACGKKADGPTPIGTTHLSIDLRPYKDFSPELKEVKPGWWDLKNLGPDTGQTHVTVSIDRGMPALGTFEARLREDALIGDVSSLDRGPGGMVIHNIKKKDNQWFIYVYLPTKDGAALCEGWSQKSATAPSIEVCRTLTTSAPGTGEPPAAAAPAPSSGPPPAAPPAPPKP